MLFSTHLGEAKEAISIARWMEDLDRNSKNIWSSDKTNVKDFRACQDLFDTILDGFIVAFLVDYCGFDSVSELTSNLEQMGSDHLASAVEKLADLLNDYSAVTKMRKLSPEYRDQQYENLILFMQQGLVLRNFAIAMRNGDSGMVIDCLSYFTVWFQATKKYNYAFETIHLTACIKQLWSPEMRQYWMENCLVNPSGKREGWMACDYLGEYIVREVKAMMHHNVNEANSKFLRLTLSPLILNFRNMRKLMTQECDVPFQSQHSSKVDTQFDVRLIARTVLQDQFCQIRPGRTARNAIDLHGVGIQKLSTQVGIKKYIAKMDKDQGYVNGNVVEDPVAEEHIEIGVEDDMLSLFDEELDGWFDS